MTKFKDELKKIFNRNKEIICPAFPNEKIVFNAKGINHLIYKGGRSRREMSRIETNIRLLPSAIKVLKLMPLAQEETYYIREGIKYQFWTFEAVIDNRRIKVIIRQAGKGKKHFWSVIPAWRKDRYGILNAKNRDLEKE
ncbi:MAG: hypothetical protein US86_C0004G0016 [Candidatus Daviesbacteria bacterium GW2011_GWA2_38_24]|uniref:Phage-Barnase-EndoU-ColicinE5/D-RelE like nuclease 3 domain-containing protein n=1 Tax=Candidatus Daviesbacteria bacterium GW2011_GWA2_38_24 TaxID=1618422 RepID=A0A0G0JG94_9BACT|nr:MAG: hypothetical protein US86_C0004G0016 [Candidatus Daviesbacteria bacterium GW2011_GWA2_38_24]